MENALRWKVALIAGGGRGIGAATAKLLAARGALVIVNYLKNEAAAKRVVAEIHAKGQLAVAVQADAREPEHVQTMVGACSWLEQKVGIGCSPKVVM